MNIKLVVFDMAGTTVEDNRYVHKALIEALKDHKVNVTEEEANEVMGLPKPVAILNILQKKYEGDDRIYKVLIDKIHANFVKRMVDFYENSKKVRAKKGVESTFKALRRNNIKIAIDTGFSRDIADVIIQRLGWVRNNLIDLSITSDEVANGRPHPDMIFKAMEKTGINNPEQVAKVGDTASDIQQGKSAGCKLVIGVTSGAYKREALAAEEPTHLVSELSEILKIFQLEEAFN